MSTPHHHRRMGLHAPATLGQRAADAIARGMGSWRFIIAQSLFVAIWAVANVYLLTHPFDKYPFILLNLLFSTQAAYAAPIIMMSQNRQAERDRRRDDLEAEEVHDAHEELHLVRRINEQQVEEIGLIKEAVYLLKQHLAQQPPVRTRRTLP